MQQGNNEQSSHEQVAQVATRYIVCQSEGTYEPVYSFAGDEVVILIAKQVHGHNFVARTRIPACASLKKIARSCDELLGQMRRLWLNTAAEFGWI
jgi:hypothetical protein